MTTPATSTRPTRKSSTPELPNEALEAAAGTMAGHDYHGLVNIIPPNWC